MVRCALRVIASMSLVLCLMILALGVWSNQRSIRFEYAFHGKHRVVVLVRGRLWMTNKPHRVAEELEVKVLDRRLAALSHENNLRNEEFRALFSRGPRDLQNSPEMQRVNDVQARLRVVASMWRGMRA